MFKSKTKIGTGILLVLTVFFLSAIGYITFIIISGSGERAKTSPQKTKASNITYSKTIALNTSYGNQDLSSTLTPTQAAAEATPTPTETVLAYANPTASVGAQIEASPTLGVTAPVSQTTTPAITSLPQAGSYHQAFLIFSGAALLVFFSLIF